MRIIVSFLFILSLFACSATPEEVTQDRRSRSLLDENPYITLNQFKIGDFALQYAEAGDPGKPTVVFIHGTPGSWRSLGRLMVRQELREAAHLVSIDRPGWGGSQLEEKRTEPDFAAQSALVEPFLRHLKGASGGQPLILVGHSYGGSIAPYLAYRNPDLVDGLLMASSAIDPRLGRPRWYNRAASIWPISRLIDFRLQKANDEIWGVAQALEELESWWESATIPMIYMQGEEDELVHPKNLDFAEKMLPGDNSKVVRLPEQGHLVHIQQRDLLSDLTLEILEKALDVPRFVQSGSSSSKDSGTRDSLN